MAAKIPISPEYKDHARPRLCEALPFRFASRYGPVLEGLVAYHAAKLMRREEDRVSGTGLPHLMKASVDRLNEMAHNKEKWIYTRRHSLEVAYFSYLIASEAQKSGAPEAAELSPRMVFAGGYMHDIGKTFLPLELVVKELGVDLVLFCLLEGSPMNDVERAVLRDEHIRNGTRFVRLFGNDDGIRTILDMVGLHHVMYVGKKTAFPSYPSQMKGSDLPLHSRIAKTADFLSAVLPRHYRTDQWVDSMRESLAYAVAVAGWELDPLTLRCAMTGLHGIGAEEADAMVKRLAPPHDQPWGAEVVNSREASRKYIKEVIHADAGFRRMLARRDRDKEEDYRRRISECAQEFGAPVLGSITS